MSSPHYARFAHVCTRRVVVAHGDQNPTVPKNPPKCFAATTANNDDATIRQCDHRVIRDHRLNYFANGTAGECGREFASSWSFVSCRNTSHDPASLCITPLSRTSPEASPFASCRRHDHSFASLGDRRTRSWCCLGKPDRPMRLARGRPEVRRNDANDPNDGTARVEIDMRNGPRPCRCGMVGDQLLAKTYGT
jgi:hypothetical protein